MINNDNTITTTGLQAMAQDIIGLSERVDIGSLQMVRHFPSRTATIYHCTTSDGGYAIKVGRDWSPADACSAFESLVTFGASVDSETRSVLVPKPIGWTEEPASLWMEFVPGTPLSDIIAELALSSDNASFQEIHHYFEECGTSLAAFHQKTRSSEHNTADSLSKWNIVNKSRWLLLNQARLGRIIQESPAVQLFLDYAPWNLVVSADGQLYVLDPPTTWVEGLPHSDLNQFIMGLVKEFAMPRWQRRSDLQELRITVVTTFLNAYQNKSGIPVESDEHQWLMLVHEAVRRTQRVGALARSRRLKRVFYEVAMLVRARVDLSGYQQQVFLEHIGRPPGLRTTRNSGFSLRD